MSRVSRAAARVETARKNLDAARTHEAANPGSEAHRAARQGRELDLTVAENAASQS